MLNDLRPTLLLNMVPGVGPRLYQRLLERFGQAAAILGATEADLRSVPGVGSSVARAIADATSQLDVDRELEDCQRHGIQLMIFGREDYPPELALIPDPPPVLYCLGQWRPEDRLAIAMVGSRHVTDYGIKVANQLGRGLAQAGFCVVSGMARGADAAAHRAALGAGGRTLAVLGSGLLNLYPPDHADLAREIVAQGALLSEVPLHRPPHSGAFPQRNRIVSGLSLGVVVLEAASRSGALITARHAMEQNRELFAVPGRIDSRASQGCNDLIRDGATLVQSVEDILEQLGPLCHPILLEQRTLESAARSAAETAMNASSDTASIPGGGDQRARGEVTSSGPVPSIRQPAELKLNEQETLVLQAIAVDPTYVDEIVAATQLPVSRVLATLSVLQARRLIRRIGGNQVARL